MDGWPFTGGRQAPALDVTLRLARSPPSWAVPFQGAASLCKSPARVLPAATLDSPECHCSARPSQGAGGYFPYAAICSNLLHGLFHATLHHVFSIPCTCQGLQFRSQVYYPSKPAPVEKRSLYVKKTPHLHSQLPASISSPHGAQKAMLWPTAIFGEADAPPDLSEHKLKQRRATPLQTHTHVPRAQCKNKNPILQLLGIFTC